VTIPLSARFPTRYTALVDLPLPACYTKPFVPGVSRENLLIIAQDPYATLMTLYALTGRVIEYKTTTRDSDAHVSEAKSALERDLKAWASSQPPLAVGMMQNGISVPMASWFSTYYSFCCWFSSFLSFSSFSSLSSFPCFSSPSSFPCFSSSLPFSSFSSFPCFRRLGKFLLSQTGKVFLLSQTGKVPAFADWENSCFRKLGKFSCFRRLKVERG